MSSREFKCVYVCDITDILSVKIATLEGTREKPTAQELLDNPMLEFSGRNQDCADLQVECIIYSDPKNITPPILTKYKAFTTRWNWNEWVKLPIKFCDIPRNSQLLITIYDYEAPMEKVVVGGTSIPLVDINGVFQSGLFDLRVWPKEAGHPEKTPGIGYLVDGKEDEIHRLNKLVKKHEAGEIPRVDWLDRLVFREINVINDQNKRSSKYMYLTIEFPKLVVKEANYHIVWWEKSAKPDQGIMNKYYKDMPLYDPELGLENLYERKHHLLTRSLQTGVTDKDLKPNSTNRDKLLNIIQYPPTKQLTNADQDLVWKYRSFLKNHKKGLVKFLRCVKWNLLKEAEQALLLLNEWNRPDAQDALELLGPEFEHPQIRKYAVERLDSASDDELLLYLLQLVQALKYESWEVKSMHLLDESHYSLESEHCTDSSNLSRKTSLLTNNFVNLNLEESKENEENSVPSILQTRKLDKQSDLLLEGNPFTNLGENLASFLIKRSQQNPILANYFYWYLSIECEDKTPDQGLKPESKVREMYLWVMKYFKVSLLRSSQTSKQTWQIIMRQQKFVDKLVLIMKTVNKENGRLKKIEKLKSLLADPESNLKEFESLPLPLNPEVKICGIVPEEATLFKSALEPCRLTFKTVDGSRYITIFKCGDDLRQDQLIIQIITLMDKLLLNENMDLKLTPYKVLATSSKHGFVQYIDSVSIAELGRKQTNIQTYLKDSENPEGGISPQVMDNYLRSCAGYCIITYILGIGDRHFDNLLLTKDGHLFHIDFGYILGRDPKPLPPMMKLTKEMVDAMGGPSSDNYKEFQRLCYTTYAQLRRHSSLVLNLFSLMVDANVPDIALEPDKTTQKVEDRFCLDLSDEEAVGHVQEVIDQSLNAVVAQVVEQLHRFAQYMRK